MERVEGDHELHEVVVGRMGGGLNPEYVQAADRLAEPHEAVAVGELGDLDRVHLDVGVGPERMDGLAGELEAMGGTRVAEFDEPEGHWITMLDPEGNEFCLQ